ncbi:MAG: alpha/beta hydrolase [Propionibacteriaceae bacterium]
MLWLLLGLVMLGVVGWLAWTRRVVLLDGHPLTLVLVLVCLVAGLVAVAWSLPTLVTMVRGDDRIDHLSDRQLRFRARGRVIAAVPLLLVCALLAGSLIYAAPFAASPEALVAMRSSDTVHVVDRLTWYELQPARRDKNAEVIPATTALVFAPGARVDARAYAPVLRPLAEQGILVCVLKEPLGLSITHPGQPADPIASHPAITTWAVGGHSLGGATISGYAADHTQVRGLVLYASYPIGTVRRPGIKVLSVSGSNDALATPTDIEAAKSDLPDDTTYVVVPGGVHAFFADYGAQPGDGTPGVSRATAQGQIIAATLAFMKALPAKK